MRPSIVFSLIFGIGISLFGFAVGLWLLVDREMHGGAPWHYWFAPFLALGFGAIFAQLVVMYWVKVGKTEARRSQLLGDSR